MKNFNELQEGLQDPNIFKAFFLAGGPGSGKSFVVRKSTGGTGLKIVNSDDVFEKYLKDAGLEMDMTTAKAERQKEPRDKLRDRAKVVTQKKQDNYVDGRLGLIIDGTGRDYDKIAGQSNELKRLGYDTHMIYVNTLHLLVMQSVNVRYTPPLQQNRGKTFSPTLVNSVSTLGAT
jgi:hypothetical protein